MKRGLLLVLALVACAVTQPVAIEKPVLVSTAKQWQMTGAYYQRVKMPDGSVQEIKSRTPLTAKQWQALAEELNVSEKEEVCPTCGQRWAGGIVP
jgi:hypothetical protein